MSNHLHVLLEVTPMPLGGLTDEALLKRLGAIYNEAQVAEMARELTEARQEVAAGLGEDAVLVGRIGESTPGTQGRGGRCDIVEG